MAYNMEKDNRGRTQSSGHAVAARGQTGGEQVTDAVCPV